MTHEDRAEVIALIKEHLKEHLSPKPSPPPVHPPHAAESKPDKHGH